MCEFVRKNWKSVKNLQNIVDPYNRQSLNQLIEVGVAKSENNFHNRTQIIIFMVDWAKNYAEPAFEDFCDQNTLHILLISGFGVKFHKNLFDGGFTLLLGLTPQNNMENSLETINWELSLTLKIGSGSI